MQACRGGPPALSDAQAETQWAACHCLEGPPYLDQGVKLGVGGCMYTHGTASMQGLLPLPLPPLSRWIPVGMQHMQQMSFRAGPDRL